MHVMYIHTHDSLLKKITEQCQCIGDAICTLFLSVYILSSIYNIFRCHRSIRNGNNNNKLIDHLPPSSGLK